MKLSIPAATFATLLSGKSILSKSDTIFYTELATKSDDIDIDALRRSYEQKSLHLKQKARARIENKKRLLLAFHEVSREAFLATTAKLCDPTAATDLGVLDNSCPPNQFCIDDSTSALGGVCAKVVVRKVGDHLGEDGVVTKSSRNGDIARVMKQKTQVRDGLESEVNVGGDEYIYAVDEDEYYDRGYKDNHGLNVTIESNDSYVDVDGFVVREGIDDGVKTVSSPRLLKLSSMQDSWKAEHILERSRAGSEEYSSLVGGECNPGTNDRFVDVGIFNGCSNGYFCSKDSSSNLGGTCVNIARGTSDTFLIPRDLFEGEKHRHLLTCDYLNGTSGEKCSGFRACGDLSPDFIANNIGCGSCNAFGACRGLSATSSVGEGSCNGGNACRGVLTDHTYTLIVQNKSCNYYYSCSYIQGNGNVYHDSCNGVYACMGLDVIIPSTLSSITIKESSCNKDGACKGMSGNSFIGSYSCNDCYSCSYSSGVTTISNGSCNDLRSCSGTLGLTSISNQSCNGTYSCKGIQGDTYINSGSCNSDRSCSYLIGNTNIGWNSCTQGPVSCVLFRNGVTIGEESCNGLYSCQGLSDNIGIAAYSCNGGEVCKHMSGSTVLSLGTHSCNGNRACNSFTGLITIGDHSCSGGYTCEGLNNCSVGDNSCRKDGACRNLRGSSNRIYSGSCIGELSCGNRTGVFFVGNFSCLGVYSCGDDSAIYGSFTAGSGSCVGDGSCAANSGNLSVSDLSCVGPGACARIAGVSVVHEDACSGANACSGLYASSIGFESCLGEGACALCNNPRNCASKSSSPISVGQYSCQGCYACRRINGITITIGDDSCLGFSACEELSGNVTVGDESCYGLRACSNSSDYSTIMIDSHSCVGARSCMTMSGNSVVSNASCVDPQACRYMNNGNIGYHSCIGREACFDLEGIVNSWSCQGLYSCKNAHNTASSNQIGHNSCNAAYACQNNTALIGDCLCLSEHYCEDNTIAMDYDGCAPSSSPSPTSTSPTNQLSRSPSFSPSSSFVPSSSPSASTRPSPTPLDLSLSPSSQPSQISSLTPSTIQSDLPSETHSTVPSLLSSQSPSFYPSMTPSQVCFHQGQKIKIEATSNKAIQVFEVQVLSDNINVALGKTATQSSTFGSNNDKFGANNAVDGDLDTFIHTERTNSWWMVDLGALFSVESIHILNRWCKDSSDPHGCLCRLSNASVSLLDEDNDIVAAFSTNDTCGAPEVDISFISPCLTASPSASPTALSCLPKAQIVKLHQPNTGLPIHVFEVKAMNSSGINIAQGATATQSSTLWNNQDKFGANNAVDGDSDTFTHTKSESNPWWKVDLGDNYDVSSIEIMNRWCKDINDSANCLCRLSGATISLVDDSGTEVTAISTGDTCGQANLEFVFESSPEFCQNTSLDSASPTKQSTQRSWHERELRKRPTKC